MRKADPFVLTQLTDTMLHARYIFKGTELIYRTTQHATRHLIVALSILTGIASHNTTLAADEPTNSKTASISNIVTDDYRSFYKSDRLIRMGIAFGAGAIAANTNIDMSVRNWYQDNVRSEKTNSWASNTAQDREFNAKFFGEGKYMIPVALLAASVNYIDTDTAVGNWGASASRAYIVGLPAMWAMQFTTGAARPSHNAPSGSAWRPFNNDGYAHGVSGHSFVGAVPFLTIAYMNPDNGWVKYPAYLASMAAGWSRVNDDAHFPSQVVLGWYMAWEAVDSVFENNEKKKGLTVAPMVELDGFGLIASGHW